MAASEMIAVRDYFGMNSTEFVAEWRKLSNKDKADLKSGIGNGSLNY